MNTDNWNWKFLLKALGLSGLIALTMLLAGTWYFSRSTKPAPLRAPGANAVQVSPTARVDLEAVYHQAWLAVPKLALDQDKFTDWAQWEHKFDGKIKTEKQLRDAISQMLASRGDHYMVVLTQGEASAFEQSTSGKLVGIGVSLNGPMVVSVVSGSPAEKAGLKPGDIIAYVDGKPVRPGDPFKLMTLLRGNGQEGSTVVLVVMRDKKPVQAELTRAVIRKDTAVRTHIGREFPFFFDEFGMMFRRPFGFPNGGFGGGFGSFAWRPLPKATPAAFTQPPASGFSGGSFSAFQNPFGGWGGFGGTKDTTGAVRIDNLRSESVIPELDAALQDMDKESMEGIVLDLRGLRGGSGMTAAQATALFMPGDGKLFNSVERVDGKEVVTTYELKGGKLVVTASTAGGQPVVTLVDTVVNRYKKPVFVIVDGQTSGAAELIAAALQGNHRATVFGVNTKGKLTGQRNFAISHGYVLRITVARYSTPDNQRLDGVGVKPDMQGDTAQGNLYGQAVLALRANIEKNRPKAEVKPANGDPGAQAKPGDGSASQGAAKPGNGSGVPGTVKPADGSAPKGTAKP